MTANVEDHLVRKVRELELLEQEFSKMLVGGQLRSWSLVDIRDALQLSAQHKLCAIQAIERENIVQAINNVDMVIYLISGFVEDIEDVTLN